MRLTCSLFTMAFMCLSIFTVQAQDAKPIKALLITGGGYHDYAKQKSILTEGISKRANVEFTVILENPKKGAEPEVYKNEKWYEGYDVIIHNECFASYKEDAGVEKIVKAHLDHGIGSVMIHCAMHTFRDAKSKEWDKLVGVESRRHGAKFPIVIRNMAPKNPIMVGFPKLYTTPQGELYHTKPLMSTETLGIGFKEGEEEKGSQVCIWANTYGKAKTFGTTLGHHNETMEQEEYLDLVARGMLWTVGKLGKDGKPSKGYEGSTAQRDIKFKVMLANGTVMEFNNVAEFAAAKIPANLTVNCCGKE